MQLCTITSHLSRMNEKLYYLNDLMFYLESNAEVMNVSSSVEHQSAGRNS